MHNLIRMYNQNRIKIWVIIIGIIISITVIQNLNKAIRDENKEKNNKITEQQQNISIYKNESKSMVSGGTVSDAKQDEYGNLIEQFLKYCINSQPEKAYDLLSSDCKKVLYPSERLFEDLYYNGKFNENKKYSFQSWSSSDRDIYLVKVYDNMLTTGKDNTSNYLQDYFTIVKENGNYKLNVGGFLGIKDIQKSKTKDNITIFIKNCYIYMDYQIFNLEVSNTTDNIIKLTQNNDGQEIYLQDSNDIKFNAMFNENIDEDFIIEKNKKKSLQIKFSNSYRVDVRLKKIGFSNIIKNYEKYKQELDNYKDIIDIEIEL